MRIASFARSPMPSEPLACPGYLNARKFAWVAVICLCTPFLSHAGERTKQFIKTSKTRLNPAGEVAAYYEKLNFQDADVRKQYDTLTKPERDADGVQFFADRPTVVECAPCEESWDAGRIGEKNDTYLLFQNIGIARSRHLEITGTIVAKLKVHYQATYQWKDQPGGEATLVSNTVTIVWVGFLEANL